MHVGVGGAVVKQLHQCGGGVLGFGRRIKGPQRYEQCVVHCSGVIQQYTNDFLECG